MDLLVNVNPQLHMLLIVCFSLLRGRFLWQEVRHLLSTGRGQTDYLFVYMLDEAVPALLVDVQVHLPVFLDFVRSRCAVDDVEHEEQRERLAYEVEEVDPLDGLAFDLIRDVYHAQCQVQYNVDY